MLEGLDQFDRVVSGWFDEVEKASQEAAAGLAEVALQHILDESPQYTGDFVSGWEVGFTVAPNIWRPAKLLSRQMIEIGGLEPYQKGDEPAIEWALNKSQPRFSAAAKQPLGTGIFLSNSAKHEGDYYAWKIEHGEIDFRPVNPNADRLVERGVDFIYNRYKHIGKSQLAVLRSLGV